jgi:hypothetical protein
LLDFVRVWEYCPYADFGRGARAPAAMLLLPLPYAEVEAVRERVPAVAREVEVEVEAEKARSFLATVLLTLVDVGRVDGGATGLRVYGSAAFSASVLRLAAGSGTGQGSARRHGTVCRTGKTVRPEGLCLLRAATAAGRAFMLDVCNSARARGGDEIWGRREGGLMPEGLEGSGCSMASSVCQRVECSRRPEHWQRPQSCRWCRVESALYRPKTVSKHNTEDPCPRRISAQHGRPFAPRRYCT